MIRLLVLVGLALAKTQALTFACRCFCGSQNFRVDEHTRVASYEPGSVRYVFKPHPIPIESPSKLREILGTVGNNLYRAGVHVSGDGTGVAEYFSGVLVQAGPDLDPVETLAVRQAIELMGGPRVFQSMYVNSLLPFQRPMADEYFQQRPFKIEDLDSANQMQLTILRAPPGTDDADLRAECILRCRDRLLSLPVEIQRIAPHSEYGLLKDPSDFPNPGEILSTERPQWGRRRPKIPFVAKMPIVAPFIKAMRDKWQALFFMAARYDPITGSVQLKNANDLSLARELNVSLTLTSCSQIEAYFNNLVAIPSSWSRMEKEFRIRRKLTDFYHPESLNVPGVSRLTGLDAKLQGKQASPHVSFLQQTRLAAPLPGGLSSLMQRLGRVPSHTSAKQAALQAPLRPQGPVEVVQPSLDVPGQPVEMLDQKPIEGAEQSVQKVIASQFRLLQWPQNHPETLVEQITPSFRFRISAIAQGDTFILSPIYSGRRPSPGAFADSLADQEFLNFPITAQESLLLKKSMEQIVLSKWIGKLSQTLAPYLAEAIKLIRPIPQFNVYGQPIPTRPMRKPDASQLLRAVDFEVHGALFLSCYSHQADHPKDQQVETGSSIFFVAIPVWTQVEFADSTRAAYVPEATPAVLVLKKSNGFEAAMQNQNDDFQQGLRQVDSLLHQSLVINIGTNLGGRFSKTDNLLNLNTCPLRRDILGVQITELPLSDEIQVYEIINVDKLKELEYAIRFMGGAQGLAHTSRLLAKCAGLVLPGSEVSEAIGLAKPTMLPPALKGQRHEASERRYRCVDDPTKGKHVWHDAQSLTASNPFQQPAPGGEVRFSQPFAASNPNQQAAPGGEARSSPPFAASNPNQQAAPGETRTKEFQQPAPGEIQFFQPLRAFNPNQQSTSGETRFSQTLTASNPNQQSPLGEIRLAQPLTPPHPDQQAAPGEIRFSHDVVPV